MPPAPRALRRRLAVLAAAALTLFTLGSVAVDAGVSATTPTTPTAPAPIGSSSTDVCTWPVIGIDLPLTAQLTSPNIVSSLPQPQRLPTFTYTYSGRWDHAIADYMQAFVIGRFEGTIVSHERLVSSSGQVLPFDVTLTIANGDVQPNGDVTFVATGTSPNIVLLKPGDASVIEDSLEMHLVAWWSDTNTKAITFDAGADDKDGDPTTFDVSCKRKSAPLTVARVFVGENAPEATPTPVPTATPVPAPTNGPSITDPAPATPAPQATPLAEPQPVILDLRVLRFRNWIVPRKLGAACPKTATVLVKAAKTRAKAGKLTRRLAVSRIGLKCGITGSIHLTAKLAHAGDLVVTVTGTGLRPLSRRVSKY